MKVTQRLTFLSALKASEYKAREGQRPTDDKNRACPYFFAGTVSPDFNGTVCPRFRVQPLA